MRLLIGCVLLLLAPIAGIVGYKQYQILEAERQKAATHSWGSTRGEVLFFNASWCGPCRQMKPIVAQLRRQGYHMRDIDVDRNRAMAEKYGIRAVPTFVFLENGAEVSRFSGGTSRDHLIKLCSAPIYH